MADKATQTLNKENKATQTDLPNDKATQTYNFDDETKKIGGSSKSFKSKLITKAEAEAFAFTYDPNLYDDDDDDDNKKKMMTLIDTKETIYVDEDYRIYDEVRF